MPDWNQDGVGLQGEEKIGVGVEPEREEQMMEAADRSYVDQMLKNQSESTAKDIALMREQIKARVDEVERDSKSALEKATGGVKESVLGVTTKLDGMETTVQSLSTAQTAGQTVSTGYAEQIAALKAELAERPSEERVRELMTECISDPGGSACQFLAGMARQSAEELQGGAEEEGLHIKGEGDEEGILPHLNWRDVLECTDGCKDGICEVLPDHPGLISDALKKLKEKNPEKYAELMNATEYAKPAVKNPSLDPLFGEG